MAGVDAPIDGYALAILFLLFAFAFLEMMHYSIALPARQLGLPGKFLADGIDAAANAVWGTIKSLTGQGMGAISRMLHALGNNNRIMFEAIANTFVALANATVYVADTEIPQQINAVEQAAVSLANQAQTNAVNYAEERVQQSFNTLSTYIQGQVGAITGEIGGVQSFVGQLGAAIESQLQSVVTQVNEQAQALEGELRGEVSAVAGALSAEIGAVKGEAEYLYQTAIAGAETLVGQASEALNHDYVARDAAIAATAAAATAAVAETVSTFIDECGGPVCDAFGGLSKLLPGLEAILAGVGVLAAIEYAHRDPDGAAGAVKTLVSGPLGAARDALGIGG